MKILFYKSENFTSEYILLHCGIACLIGHVDTHVYSFFEVSKSLFWMKMYFFWIAITMLNCLHIHWSLVESEKVVNIIWIMESSPLLWFFFHLKKLFDETLSIINIIYQKLLKYVIMNLILLIRIVAFYFISIFYLL